MRIYTRKGDDGTTGLLYGGRVDKDSPRPNAYGSLDEAQAALGVARAECERDDPLDQLLIRLERDLWVLMAELAAHPDNRDRLEPGASLVTSEMVDRLESEIDQIMDEVDLPTEFVVPGQTRLSAALDLARTVVRRAERDCLAVADPDGAAIAYLNRLSDLVWTLARRHEGDALATRTDDA